MTGGGEWHGGVPWDRLRRLYRAFRREFFSRPRPDGPYLRVERRPEWLEMWLGQRSYAPNWEASYRKEGEVLNLARVVWDGNTEPRPTQRDTARGWKQTHIRGWEAPGGATDLRAHYELEPTENAAAHLNGGGFSVPAGMRNLRRALDHDGVEYAEVRDWRRAPGGPEHEEGGG